MILVAIGANLPGPWGATPLETCRRAARELRRLDGLQVLTVSRFYRTTPVPRSAQPDYANAMVRLAGDAEPAALLAALQAIEQAAGRSRGARDAARTLDLDIIDIAGQLRDSPDPVLPHPRTTERAFVLVPLADVAPDWIDPRSGRGVAALLAAIRGNGCCDARVPLDWPIPYS
ncbi:2-amino-4-hydroxy-6-hydroxymethyldihydropteridine diphosphokinase [Lichenicoccus sp.]|uniref:2-amino-4-hydroxy-6- hydroxymethyldihydropteridine diphosphokinase n=1 Tax=Lichenicoccus sp. TaxID=2781899 RepID=UPI003D1507E9